MNIEKLNKLNELFADEIAHKRITDAAIQVEHKGQVCFTNYFGKSDKDSIYRIYSMTKPITSTAMMMLFEQGKFDLDEPVSRYLPFFADMKVVVPDGYDTGNATGLETTKRGTLIMDCPVQITIRNILNMTSGLVYPGNWGGKAEYEMFDVQQQLYKEYDSNEPLTGMDVMKRLASCPLAFVPGTGWLYGISADVCGVLVEAVSGMKYGDFLKQNIFEPLGMKDTWFSVPKEKLPRLIHPSHRLPDGTLVPADDGQMLWLGQLNPDKEQVFQSGGGYLYSTLEDYSRFARILMNGGTVNGKNFLGRKTVDFMHQNQLTPEQLKMFWLANEGYGYANLMRTMMNPEKTGNGTAGEFGWDGLAGTYFFIDPKEELQVVYMQQIGEGADPNLRRKFRNIIYSALE